MPIATSSIGVLRRPRESTLDAYGRVVAGIVAGRLQLPPAAAELAAAVWFDRAVTQLPPKTNYPKRRASLLAKPAERLAPVPPGFRPFGRPAHELKEQELIVPQRYHPDPFVEAIRRGVTEHEQVQLLGRYRGVNRTTADPVLVLLLSSVPLNLEIDYVVKRSELDVPDTLALISDRNLAFVPAHRGALAALLPDVFCSPHAVKRTEQADAELQEAMAAIGRYRAVVVPDGGVFMPGQIVGTRRNGRQLTIPVAMHPNKSEAEKIACLDRIAVAVGLLGYQLNPYQPEPWQPGFDDFLTDLETAMNATSFAILDALRARDPSLVKERFTGDPRAMLHAAVREIERRRRQRRA